MLDRSSQCSQSTADQTARSGSVSSPRPQSTEHSRRQQHRVPVMLRAAARALTRSARGMETNPNPNPLEHPRRRVGAGTSSSGTLTRKPTAWWAPHSHGKKKGTPHSSFSTLSSLPAGPPRPHARGRRRRVAGADRQQLLQGRRRQDHHLSEARQDSGGQAPDILPAKGGDVAAPDCAAGARLPLAQPRQAAQWRTREPRWPWAFLLCCAHRAAAPQISSARGHDKEAPSRAVQRARASFLVLYETSRTPRRTLEKKSCFTRLPQNTPDDNLHVPTFPPF